MTRAALVPTAQLINQSELYSQTREFHPFLGSI
jgi:hypothetical protein